MRSFGVSFAGITTGAFTGGWGYCFYTSVGTCLLNIILPPDKVWPFDLTNSIIFFLTMSIWRMSATDGLLFGYFSSNIPTKVRSSLLYGRLFGIGS